MKRQGYEVATADSVASALEAVKRDTFQLLVCDIGLPDGTGFQLIEEVRKHTRTPALALSGFGMEEDVAQIAPRRLRRSPDQTRQFPEARSRHLAANE